MDFSTNLSEYRLKKKLSQKQLAELMNVSTGTIAEWESGEVIPSIQQLCDLSKLLNVSVDELLGNTCESSTAKTEFPNITLTKESKMSSRKTPLIISAVLLLLIALLVVLQPWKKSFSQNTEAIEFASDSVVKVICYNQFGDIIATGSGFALFDDHTFITNHHVIDGASAVKICSDDDIMFDVHSIRDYSEDYDTAILIVEEATSIAPLSVDKNYEIERGEPIIAIGSPLGLKNTVSQGNFSGHVFKDPVQLLQFTAPISSGSSGGALFNDKGNVIGITFASYVDGQNLNLAIPITHAIDLYENATYTKVTLKDDFIKYPRLTIQELNTTYANYIDKSVIVEGYISSKESGYWSSSLFLCSTPNVDGNYTLDNNMWYKYGCNYPDILSINGINFWLNESEVPGDIGQYITAAGKVRAKTNENGTTRIEISLESIYYHNS